MFCPSRRRIAVLIFAVAGFAWACGLSKAEFEERFTKVENGQPRSDLIRSLGEPTEVEPCTENAKSFYQKKGLTCAESLRYIRFLEIWTVSLDADGKVLGKGYQVSP
jgi:hypothetical protein